MPCAVDECLFEGCFVAAHDGHGDTDAGGGEDEPDEAKERFQPRRFKRRQQKPLQPYPNHPQPPLVVQLSPLFDLTA